MKRAFSVLLIFCAIFLCACGSGGNAPQEMTPTQTTEGNATAPNDAALTEEQVYNAFLSRLHKKLNAIIGDDTHLDGFDAQEGMVGVAEIAATSKKDMLKEIGYAIFDINSDGASELVLCKIDESSKDTCSGTRILCAFTVSENETVLLFSGTSQNRHYILEDATVYNEIASTGAGVYQFDNEKNAYSCVDFYFSVMGESDQPVFLHNHSGLLDASVSDPFEGDENAFRALLDGFTSRIQTIELVSMEAFAH